MDIVITLPSSLWNKIVSGKKTIELRKSFPKLFDVDVDKVYVILKGTPQIVGCFYVRSFEWFYARSIRDFEPILAQISVPRQWIVNYVGYSSAVYLWHIRYVRSFPRALDRSVVWNMNTNPQSFVYIRKYDNSVHPNRS